MSDDVTDSGTGAGAGSGAGPGAGYGTGPGAGSRKEMSTGAQVFAAVAAVGVILGGLWLIGDFLGRTPGTVGPAVCSSSDDASPAPRGKVSGARLCTALNRADLPELLGTPTERAVSASGGDSESKWADGTRTVTPEATVELDTYAVKLSASFDDLPVAEAEDHLGADAESRTVLGHRAVLYSGQTMSISFRLDGGDATSGPGGVARRLLVATDPKDSGSTFELVIWRQDTQRPDDAALFRVAEKVLPKLQGWKPAG